MKKSFILVFTLLIASCASVKNLDKAPVCNVWKEQFMFGPVHVSVDKNGASWSGNCKGLWWDCKNASTTFNKDTGEVYLSVYDDTKYNWNPQKPIGKIINNKFFYNEKNPLEKYISFTPMTANVDVYTVTYQVDVPFMKLNSEVVYHFNKNCNATQALLGTLTVGAVERIKSDTAEKEKPFN